MLAPEPSASVMAPARVSILNVVFGMPAVVAANLAGHSLRNSLSSHGKPS